MLTLLPKPLLLKPLVLEVVVDSHLSMSVSGHLGERGVGRGWGGSRLFVFAGLCSLIPSNEGL